MLPDSIKENAKTANALFRQHYPTFPAPSVVAVAPGRVNLIGEHVDYTGGFVLPFAIDYCTVVVGTGSLQASDSTESKVNLRFVSSKSPTLACQFQITAQSKPPANVSWTTYVVGTVYQYLVDLPQSSTLELTFAISGNVPLGSGLSSSASLEVAVARFVEEVIGDIAFSGEQKAAPKLRALRCQKAENEWARSPCGLMDQYISSAGQLGSLLLIDCTSLDYQVTKMANTSPQPVLVVANSNVHHDIGGGEYPVRVAQCKIATQAIQKVNPNVQTLRDAAMEDVDTAKDGMDQISYKRAKHVVTENARTLEAQQALEAGDWSRVGALMNGSHASMRDDYEVSCWEIDILVEIAQSHPGVYGSRLTGGGFGGCTVTLVEKEHAAALVAALQSQYKEKTGKRCPCFETQPAKGAHVLPSEILQEL